MIWLKRILKCIVVYPILIFVVLLACTFIVNMRVFLSINLMQVQPSSLDQHNASHIYRQFAHFHSSLIVSFDEAWTVDILSEPTIQVRHSRDTLENVVVVVKSRADGQAMRDVIRTTWGTTFKHRLAFAVGTTRPTAELWREQSEHADLLIMDFADSYKNLTLKTVQCWKYMAKLKQNNDLIGWFFYIDSDVYVLAENLRSFVDSLKGQSNRMYGKVVWLPWLKREMAVANNFPYLASYAIGAMQLVTADVPAKLTAPMPLFPPILTSEDMYTGFLRELSQVQLIADAQGRFCWFWPSMITIALHEYFCDYGRAVAVCELHSPNQMRSWIDGDMMLSGLLYLLALVASVAGECTFTKEEGKKLVQDYDVIQASSVQDCALKCYAADCVSAGFDRQTSRCHLSKKDIDEQASDDISDPDAHSDLVFNIDCSMNDTTPAKNDKNKVAVCQKAEFESENKWYTRRTYKTVQVGDKETCSLKCLLDKPCKSAVYSANNGCELSKTTKVDSKDAYKSDDDSVYLYNIKCKDTMSGEPEEVESEPYFDDDGPFIYCGMGAKPSSANTRLANVQPTTASSRIVGGEETKLNAWPWQISMMRIDFWNNNPKFPKVGAHQCGGSLIRVSTTTDETDMILTAAHCFQYSIPSLYQIWAGEHDLVNQEATEQYQMAKKIWKHERYRPSQENDLAIVQLRKPIRFKAGAKPVCLSRPSTTVPEGKKCFITGWGKLDETVAEPSKTLQELVVPVLANDTCLNAPKNWTKQMTDGSTQVYSLPGFVPEKMVCAGYITGGKDSCQGDSGGPMVCQNAALNNKFELHGATSFGGGCARVEYPGVYTRISAYCDWIKEKICKYSRVPGHDSTRFCHPQNRCK